MASSSRLNSSMGRIGPKISSCMTGLSGETPSSSVGATKRVFSSNSPPTTAVCPSNSAVMRAKCFSDTITGISSMLPSGKNSCSACRYASMNAGLTDFSISR